VPSPPSQIDQIFDRRDKVFVGQDALGRIDVNPKLLIDLVAADSAKIVFLSDRKKSRFSKARALATVGGSPGRRRR